MKIPIYQVDAFAEALFQGNPAAVCPLEGWLPDELLQSIAFENGLSETAYLVRKEDRFEIRWFTPEAEVELCGHATLASALVIQDKLGHPVEDLLLDSRSGPLRVRRGVGEACFALDFPASPREPIPIPEAYIAAMGVPAIECYEGLYTMLVYESEACIRGLAPDRDALLELVPMGFLCTARGVDADFVSRFFCPKYGMLEDPVTGSAHTMSAPYWGEQLEKTELTARQLSRRGGSLLCRLREDRVEIEGRAICYLEGQIDVDLP